MSEEVVSQISATVEKSVETASDTALRVGRAGLVAASAALSEALAPVAAKASEVYASARASAAELEEVAAVRAHSLLDAAAEAPGAAAGASLTLLALALPSSRRFLYRQTIGRLRSDAALAASAASRATALRGTVYEQQKEVAKLAERVLLASDEYTRGRSKLIAAGGQLRALGRAARRVLRPKRGFSRMLSL